METRSALTRGKQTGNIGHLRIGVDADATHHVVSRGSNFHRLLRDVDVRQLLELVIHAGELPFYVFRRTRNAVLDPGDIQENTTVRTAAAFTNFAHNAA